MSSKGIFSSKVALIIALLVVPWAAWIGWNGVVSTPAFLMMGVVYFFDAQPGSFVFESFRKVTALSRPFLITEPNWNATEYTLQDNEEFSFGLLRKLSKGFTRPVVFRGLGKDLRNLKTWNDPHYFIDNPKYADTEVLVVQNAKVSEQFETAQNATVYGSDVGHTGVYQVRSMRLGDALQKMIDGENMYIQNIDMLGRRHPELVQQMQFSDLLPNWKGSEPFETSLCQFFMGMGSSCKEKTTGTSMHCAYAANMFYMLVGHKDWTWIEGVYSPYIMPHYEHHVYAGFAREVPDWIPRARTTLHPGDVMFNPPWIWHEVRNHEGWTVATANRVIFPFAALRVQAFGHMISDLFGDPFTHNRIMFKDKPLRRMLLGTPLIRTLGTLALGDGYIEHNTATTNHCDEHNVKFCKASIDQSLMKTEAFKKEAGLAED